MRVLTIALCTGAVVFGGADLAAQPPVEEPVGAPVGASAPTPAQPPPTLAGEQSAPEGPGGQPGGQPGAQPGDEPDTGQLDAGEKPATPPWHRGVAEADKKRAQALFEQGNSLYDNILLIEAAEHYQRALSFWDHPAIQLNLAKTLLLLQRQVEAYDTLRRATRFGPGSHDSPAAYQWATDTLKRLESRLAVLDVRCSQPGVAISLDGQSLFSSPGVAERHLAPGQHTLVAKKTGHLTESETLVLEAGVKKTVLFSLLPITHTTVERRRWPAWTPWPVLGSAAALVSVGAVLRWRAGINYDDFDVAFSEFCGGGCNDELLPPDIAAMNTRARWQNGIGLSALIVGGAGLIAGAALVILNQPRTIRVPAGSGVHIVVAPPWGAGRPGVSAGVSARWHF